MMQNLFTRVLAVLLLVVVVFGGYQWRRASQAIAREQVLITTNQGLEARVSALQASEDALRASLETERKERNDLQALQQARKGTLNRALQDNPSWADTPLPDGVRERFQRPGPQPAP